jgi:hypothetical protein
MGSPFDFLTVGAFVCVVVAYLKWGEGDRNLLLKLLLSALTFAIANQLGNAGSIVLAVVLLAAGAGYAVLAFRR